MNSRNHSTQPRSGRASAARQFLVAILIFLPALAGDAQSALDKLMSTVGTTTTNAQGQHWAYVLWQANDPQLLIGRRFALNAKPGDKDAPVPYERKAVVALQTDPGVIGLLLNRSLNLGEDLALLESHLRTQFQQMLSASGQSLAEALSLLLRSAPADAGQLGKLHLLARTHPAVALCLGVAHAEPLPPSGQVTFELRQLDPATDEDLAVVGRVTVTAGAPTILPAPGAPVQVVEVPLDSPAGDLNARLRWATPDALRRVSLLHHGFNVFRVTKAFAEDPARRYDLNPPSTATLLALVQGTPMNVQQVNRPPVLTSKLFDAATVANFTPPTGDPTTFFIRDDHRRTEAGGTSFADGAEFYYFVTARDLLGRDGQVSPGRKVRMCDRTKPAAPAGVTVENIIQSSGQQRLQISWKQNADTPTEKHTAYFVYRWNKSTDSLTDTADPLANPHRIAGPLAAVAGQSTLSVIDTGVGEVQEGQTFWYTVRVQDNGACAPNYSTHSAPAFGVWRDRQGPEGASGVVKIRCCHPEAHYLDSNDVSAVGLQIALGYFRPTCARTDAALQWAEFYASGTDPGQFLGRAYFGASGSASLDFATNRGVFPVTMTAFYCRVGTSDGKVSAFAASPALAGPATDRIREVRFRGDLPCDRVPVDGSNDVCTTDTPAAGDPCLEFSLPPGVSEYKIYRSIDDGPQTLIGQELVDPDKASGASFCDPFKAAHGGRHCYYVQTFDEHGNPGPLVLVGACFEVEPAKLPTPMLSPLVPDGDEAHPLAKVKWFCPPAGVDRFEVAVAVEKQSPPGAFPPQLSALVKTENDWPFKLDGKDRQETFNVFHTVTVGPNFGSEAQFVINAQVETGRKYFVFVRAVGKSGKVGPMSNVEEFVWHPPQDHTPLVPWPARDLPPVTEVFHKDLRAANLSEAAYPVGVRIGDNVPVLNGSGGHSAILSGTGNPLNFTYSRNGDHVLPVALYRHEVPNAKFPKISSDAIQVSPLLEKIAYQVSTNEFNTGGPPGKATVLRDPFISVVARPGTSPTTYDMYLLDTQPVIRGARYRYLLVRFAANREIEEVIPTNEVEIP